MKTGWTGLWLRPVSCDRTRPVVTRGDLDLSGVDRTLGGSVWLLPPERSVNRNRTGSELFSVLFSIMGGPPHITAAPHRALTYSTHADFTGSRVAACRTTSHVTVASSTAQPCPRLCSAPLPRPCRSYIVALHHAAASRAIMPIATASPDRAQGGTCFHALAPLWFSYFSAEQARATPLLPPEPPRSRRAPTVPPTSATLTLIADSVVPVIRSSSLRSPIHQVASPRF